MTAMAQQLPRRRGGAELALGALALLLLPAPSIRAADSETAKSPLPRWMELTGELRGRFEDNTGIEFREGSNDFYYLHRVRGNLLLKPSSWLRFQFTGQDSEAPAERKPVPASVSDGFDIFQAYVEIGNPKASPWSARIGRQEMRYDNELLVGASNWGNTGRSYDAAKLTYDTGRYHTEAWASTVVQPVHGEVNRFTHTVQLHGIHFDAKKWLPNSTVSFYQYIKINPREQNTAGTALARSRVQTTGFRLAGILPRKFDYIAETAVQSGRSGGEPLSAWAGRYVLGQTPWKSRYNPRFYGIYSHASGDSDPTDGHRGTFDQLLPTNHSPFGIGDRISLRNMHEVAFGGQWQPCKRVTLQHEFHGFWLATRNDYFYDVGQRRVALDPNATSDHLYNEWDTQAVWTVTSHVQAIIGYAHIFPGEFVSQATPGSSSSVPYAQWLYRF